MLLQITVIAVVMLALDGIWLTARASATQKLFAAIQGAPLKINFIAVGLSYVVMILGLWWFAVRETRDAITAATKGAALGALGYGTYDLTNLATLKGYTAEYAITDWLWGTILYATTATAAVLIGTNHS